MVVVVLVMMTGYFNNDGGLVGGSCASHRFHSNTKQQS